MDHLEKTKRRFKAISYAKCRDQVAKKFQLWVRMKAATRNGHVVCVTCGKHMHYKEAHGGHYYVRRIESTLFEPTNCHPQCPGCNTYRAEERKPDYAIWMMAKHDPAELDRLADLVNQYRRSKGGWFTKTELAEMYVDYCKKIRTEQKRLGEK
jgi:hypothetical protein